MTIKTNELIAKVKKLIEDNDYNTRIPVNEIVGIDESDELVFIEEIYLNSCCSSNGVPYLDVNGATYRKVTVSDVQERRDNPDEEMWKDAVANDCTTDGLDDWWEDQCDTAEGLYPYDDDSGRYDFENEYYPNLSNKHKELIEEQWGEKGDPDEDIDSEDNKASDWLTISWGSFGSAISHDGHYVGCPETATERVEQWNLNLYPKLTKFLAKTIDDLYEKRHANDKQEV